MGATLQEMRDTLEQRGNTKHGTLLFRAYSGSCHFVELDRALVVGALDTIARKLPLVEAGLDEFNDAEKLAFALLNAHCEFGF